MSVVGMSPNEQMQMRRDHADFKNVRTLLTRDATEKAAQKRGETGIDQLGAFSRRPDNVGSRDDATRRQCTDAPWWSWIALTREEAY